MPQAAQASRPGLIPLWLCAAQGFGTASSTGGCPVLQQPLPKCPQHPQLHLQWSPRTPLLHTQQAPGHPRLRACPKESPLSSTSRGLWGGIDPGCCTSIPSGPGLCLLMAGSESLLCFVCPRQLCWIQSGPCCASPAWESNHWCGLLHLGALLTWGRARWLPPCWDQDALGTLAKVASTTLGAVGILATALPGDAPSTGGQCALGNGHLGYWQGHSPDLNPPLTPVLAPAPAALPSPTKLQPLFWAPIPPHAPGPASPAAPDSSRTCDGGMRGSGARCSSLCVPEDSATPAMALPQDRAAPVPTPVTGMGALGCRQCQHPNRPGVSMEHLSARGSHLLLDANPPLLCAKMQNILIHISLSHFFSFPCWIPRRQGIYGVSLLQPQRKPSQGQHHETGSSCQGGKERLLSAWRRRKSNQNPSKKIEI